MRCQCRFVSYPRKYKGHLIGCGIIAEEYRTNQGKETAMECRRCSERINDGEAFRAEQICPGSRHYFVYHYECYNQVKIERQRTDKVHHKVNGVQLELYKDLDCD